MGNKMDEYRIVQCRLCGKAMRRYSMQVYRGDSSCCDECNDKSGEDIKTNLGGDNRPLLGKDTQ